MNNTWAREDITEVVKKKVLWDGMQLEDLGHEYDALQGSTLLLGDAGLGLDSVDSLEIVVQVQKAFSIKIGNVNREFFETNLKTIDTLVDYVHGALA